MEVDVRNRGLKQIRDQRLREPDGVVLKPAFNPGVAILCLVEKNFAARLGSVLLRHDFTPPDIR